MQDKSAEKYSAGKRLDRLRLTLQSNWADLAAKLGLSESMVYQVKSGKKELSDKALWRLQQAEREAGIAPTPGEAVVPMTKAMPARTPGERMSEEASKHMEPGIKKSAVQRWIKLLRELANDMEREIK